MSDKCSHKNLSNLGSSNEDEVSRDVFQEGIGAGISKGVEIWNDQPCVGSSVAPGRQTECRSHSAAEFSSKQILR